MKSNTPFQAEKEAAAELSKLYYSFKTKSRPKSDFKVLAVMTVFNEKDIVQYTVSKLLKGGIQVHIIDNWSTDGSYEDLQKMASSNPDLTIERFPEQPSATYNLENLLNKVEDIARSSKADWIIHHDSDEIREACWPDIS
jgi:glycosyltransferase involved in cell wall biosynthesis